MTSSRGGGRRRDGGGEVNGSLCESNHEKGDGERRRNHLSRQLDFARFVMDRLKRRAIVRHISTAYLRTYATSSHVTITNMFQTIQDEDGRGRVHLGQELGVGFVLGLSSGFAIKKAARTLLFTVRGSYNPWLESVVVTSGHSRSCADLQCGVFFAGVQVLRSRGWIEFRLDKIEADLMTRVNFDEVEVHSKELDEAQRGVLLFLESGVPCGSAFGAGFLVGVRL